MILSSFHAQGKSDSSSQNNSSHFQKKVVAGVADEIKVSRSIETATFRPRTQKAAP